LTLPVRVAPDEVIDVADRVNTIAAVGDVIKLCFAPRKVPAEFWATTRK
jgi:hypothetical protein